MKNNLFGILLIFILVSCDSGYQKENGKWVWISYDEAVGKRITQIDEHDIESFKVLKNSNYARDKNSVFYIGRIIKDANPENFETINKDGYSKDRKYVFLDEEKIVHANPKSFKLLEFPYSKDENHIFCGTIPIDLKSEEINEFKVTNEDELMSGMKSSILLSHFIETNPEYKWLDTLGVHGVIIFQFATGETSNRKFKGFKELKK